MTKLQYMVNIFYIKYVGYKVFMHYRVILFNMCKINMINFNLLKERLVSTLFRNVLSIKNLVVFIGAYGTFIIAFKNYNIVENAFIELKDEKYLDKIKAFLNNFKNYGIYILLDHANIELRHEPIPVLESVIKVNPVERFINEHYINELTSYIVYNVTVDGNSEIYNTIISSTYYQPPLSTTIEHIFIKSFKFSGLYFLNLEFQAIIDKMLLNEGCAYNLQILVTILQASGIKVAIKHCKDIRIIKTIEYPYDKSDEYVQGTVEQAISDALIALKVYISKLESSEVYIIFLANDSMLNLFKQSTFENCKKLYFSNNEILKPQSSELISEKFSDKSITKLFLESKSYEAKNKDINSVKKLQFINSLLFKPFYFIIFILLVIVLSLKFKDIKNEYNIRTDSVKYYDITSKYRNVEQQNSLTPFDLLGLMYLYKFDNLLKLSAQNPFETIDKIFSKLKEHILVRKIKWQNYGNNSLEMNVKFDYVTNKDSLEDALSDLNEYIKTTSNLFKEYKVFYKKPMENQITRIKNKRITIPNEIIIKKN